VKIYLGTDFSDERLKFMAQIGADGVHGTPAPGPADRGFYDFTTLITLKSKVESYGLKFYSVRLAPWAWVYKWMLGLPGRDEQIENYQRTIRNMGAAGIPILTYNMHALRFYRTSDHAPARGGARATSFDIDAVKNAPLMTTGPGADPSLIPPEHRRPVTDQQMWANLAYFLKAVVPAAEESGVRLALHPDDPPIPAIAGVARIMRSPEAYRRLIEMEPSDANGVHFCQGCFTEMGADIPAEIRYFGSRNKIVAVDFRNVLGSPTKFREAFPDEGQADMAAAMKAYIEIGFDGPMTPDHAIHMDGDTEWGHRYWAYAVGHIRGLEQALRAR
jgi:mannonate dehydratase